jgi:arylsulfatase A-like enzyme
MVIAYNKTKWLAGLTIGCVATGCLSSSGKKHPQDNKKPYNVLFIAIDDLNDWVGFLGGQPQTQTPNMDKLGREGIVFEKAYCPAPISNASRAALLTGYRPSSSGIYGNESFMRDSKLLENAITIPRWLSNNGYFSMARGKIFHTPNGEWSDPQSWDLQSQTTGDFGKTTRQEGYMVNGIPVGEVDPNFDWGPTDAPFEETTDYLTAKWAADQLSNDYDKPFFLACGISKPHLTWFVPKEFFDKFNTDEIVLPPVNEDDYDDIPSAALQPQKNYYSVRKYNKQKEAVRAYLACINYADACVGVVLDALAKSKYADNTIVILWGDHGWHLGEKLRYKKFTLWEESCRMPLIIKVPGLTKAGQRCNSIVNLLDLYPTITELCGVERNPANEGRSIVPLLKDVNKKWDYPTVTTMGQNRHTVRSDRWRYIRYQDGSEELYDHSVDSMEWHNLAKDRKYDGIRKDLSGIMPAINVSEVPLRQGGKE